MPTCDCSQTYVSSWQPSQITADVTPSDGSEWAQVALTLSLMAGVIQILLGTLGLGFLVDLVSDPIIMGFTSGSAFLIASTQFSTLLGIPVGMKKIG